MTRKDDGPGVPEAIPRTLQGVMEELGAATVDRVWIFPPRIKGRRESGLVVVSRFAADGTTERRDLFTASYAAERTGKGLTVEWGISEEGTAPPDRLPPVMEGVVRRAGDDEDDPREVALGGDLEVIEELFAEWDEPLLDPTLWPRAPEPEPEPEPESGPESETESETEPVGGGGAEAATTPAPAADATTPAADEALA